MMKKFLMMLAIAGFSVTGMAQSEIPGQKYSVSTNSFWNNWFVQGHITWNAFYPGDANGQHNGFMSAPFRKFPTGEGYTGLGMAVALGKWFTPGLGLRTKVNMGRWGSKVTVAGHDIDPVKYWTANEQILFNLTNMFKGYDPNRLWHLIPFAGAGFSRNMTDNEYRTQFSWGFLNTFRLNNKLTANAELAWNNYESGRFSLANNNRHHQFSFEIGITYSIGSGRFSKTPDLESVNALMESQISALEAQLEDANAEIERLNGELEGQVSDSGDAPAE